jgi:hypothetical protein
MKTPAEDFVAGDATSRSRFGNGDGDVAAPLIANSPLPWKRMTTITVAAIALFVGFRYLPTGTNLSHMDFRATGSNVIETCDPANPQFIPVVAVKSPVMMSLALAQPAKEGAEATVTATLKTASGKSIAPQDLVVMHTKLLHLLIADPTLTDYQHVHPTPGSVPGSWEFHFTPVRAGTYRIFADFTPVATGRSLYANADLEVGGARSPSDGSEFTRDSLPSLGDQRPPLVAETEGYRFTLTPATWPIQARQMADLKFTVTKVGGGNVPMEPVMGAYAHLVAFDRARSGFAHLHPMEISLTPPPDAVQPTLNFKITIPNAGRYVIWSQVNLGGRERFVPFWFDVAP